MVMQSSGFGEKRTCPMRACYFWQCSGLHPQHRLRWVRLAKSTGNRVVALSNAASKCLAQSVIDKSLERRRSDVKKNCRSVSNGNGSSRFPGTCVGDGICA